MKAKMITLAKKIKPRMVDPRAFMVVASAFGAGVWLLSWHAASFRFEIEATNLAWIAIVAFGMCWHGEWGSGWRIGAGLFFGSLAAIASFYGAMSVFPITPFSIGVWLGVTAMAIAFIAHALPKLVSFAGTVVGFGVGIAVARALPIRPTSPADDLFAVMLTTAMGVVFGAFGSLALRALVVRMGAHGSRPDAVVHVIPHVREKMRAAR